jgi:hypothetical protein
MSLLTVAESRLLMFITVLQSLQFPGPTFEHRRGVNVAGIIVAAVLFVVLLIIVGALLPTGLGTIANGSIGSKMVNVDSTSKAIYANINIIAIIVIILVFLGIAIGVLKREGNV